MLNQLLRGSLSRMSGLVSAIRGCLIRARRNEPSSVAALCIPSQHGLQLQLEFPYRVQKISALQNPPGFCVEVFHLCMRRKRSGSWRRQSAPRGPIDSRAVQTEKKRAQWAPASAEYPRLNQQSRGAKTPHRASRNRRDCAYGCRFRSRSAAEIRPPPRCWAETRVRRTSDRGQIRGHSRCVRSR